MAPKPRYRLKRHHPFEHGGRKYAADLDTGDIVQLNDAEWDILARYDTQSDAQLIEGLKEKHKVAALFEGLERLEQLGKAGQLLRPIEATVQEPAARQQQPHPKRRLLTPFQFAAEKTSLDYVTNLNRYQLLTHLAKVAEVETLTFSEAGKTARTPEDIQAFGEIRIRHIEVEAGDTFFRRGMRWRDTMASSSSPNSYRTSCCSTRAPMCQSFTALRVPRHCKARCLKHS